jgi:hypothetical protein
MVGVNPMSKLKPTSESTRSLAARVRSLTQLRIIGPIGILTLLGIFVWQLSDHPEWFQVNTEQPNRPDTTLSNQLSDEERAIAAEIDSSNLLLEELETTAPLLAPLDTPTSAGEDLLEAVRESRRNTQTPEAANVFLPEFSTSEQSGSTPPTPNFNFSQTPQTSQTSPAFGTIFNLDSPTNTNLNGLDSQTTQGTESESTAKTPLQAAMEQYNSDSSAVNSSETEENQTTATEQSVAEASEIDSAETSSDNSSNSSDSTLQLNLGINSMQTVPTPKSPSIPEPSWVVPRTPAQSATSTPTIESVPIQNPYQTNLSIPRNLPYTPPVTPTTPSANNPYGQLPSTVNPNLTYGYSNNPSSVPNYGVVQPNVQNTTINPIPLVPQTSTNLTPSTQPFTVPRPVPGRTIGGGKINTFANP